MRVVVDSCSRHALKDHPERDTEHVATKFNPALTKKCWYHKDLRDPKVLSVTTEVDGMSWELKIAVAKTVGDVAHGRLITAYPLA